MARLKSRGTYPRSEVLIIQVKKKPRLFLAIKAFLLLTVHFCQFAMQKI